MNKFYNQVLVWEIVPAFSLGGKGLGLISNVALIVGGHVGSLYPWSCCFSGKWSLPS